MITHRFPYVVESGVTVDPDLVARLRERQCDWEWNEDGYALSEHIFRFDGVVPMHVDDAVSGTLTFGFVFTADRYWVVQMERAYEMQQGSIYMLDPLIIHGAISAGQTVFIAYICSIRPKEAQSLTYQQFGERALGAAWRLVESPQPKQEI